MVAIMIILLWSMSFGCILLSSEKHFLYADFKSQSPALS